LNHHCDEVTSVAVFRDPKCFVLVCRTVKLTDLSKLQRDFPDTIEVGLLDTGIDFIPQSVFEQPARTAGAALF
jgi:hypothetical protein